MSYKSILFNAGDVGEGSQAFATALDLARHFGAHLTGVHVGNSIRYTYEFAHGAASATLEAQDQDTHLAGKEAVLHLRERAASAGLDDSDWLYVSGDPPRVLARHSRAADLLITPSGDSLARGGRVGINLPADLALACACPVLLIPEISAAPTLPRRVLIAWKPSSQAARAVRAALPLLRDAQEVVIVTGRAGAAPGTAQREPGLAIQTLLDHHGVRAHLASPVDTPQGVTEALLSYASTFGADLICMGAYGRSRLREVLLGGVTWHMLRQVTVPVLMSH